MKRIFTSIWFLALIVAAPAIAFLLPEFAKYKLELLKQAPIRSSRAKLYFQDLDSDGKPERIEAFKQWDRAMFSFQIFEENEGMLDQFNFPFPYNAETSSLFFADVNCDGHTEVYTFSFKNDSLFLHWLQPTSGTGKIESLALCETHFYNDSLLDYNNFEVHCVDLDRDGQKELIIPVSGGFSYSPRILVKVDVKNRIVTKSENAGCINVNLKFYDLTGDGKLEIISDGSVAPKRDWFNLPYNDEAPYLKVFDSNLEYVLKPIKFFEGIQSHTRTSVVDTGENKELLTVFYSRSANCVPFRAYRIGLNGEKIDSLVFDEADRSLKNVFKNEMGNLFVQVKAGEFLEFTTDLEIVKIHKTSVSKNLNLLLKSDINEDGNSELIFSNYKRDEMYIFSDGFKQCLRKLDMVGFAVYKDAKLYKNQFYVATPQYYYTYTFSKNRFYLLRYPLWVAIYFASLLIIYLFQRAVEIRLKEKYELKNQLHELHLKTFRNQLNPHFIFNTFNGVASVIKKGDNEKAYELFLRFSRMVRSILENFDETFIPLSEELALVKNFIELQKFRFKDLFDHQIKIESKQIEHVLIPRMLIQIHVENAIKHGFLNGGNKGELEIRAKMNEDVLRITIADNGIGREKAKEFSNGSTGLGLKIIENVIRQVNLKRKNKLKQQIIDLRDEEGRAAGTRVEIEIPIG